MSLLPRPSSSSLASPPPLVEGGTDVLRQQILLMRQAKQRQQLAALTEALALNQSTSPHQASQQPSFSSLSPPPLSTSHVDVQSADQVDGNSTRSWYAGSTNESWYAGSTDNESDSDIAMGSTEVHHDQAGAESSAGHSCDESTSAEESTVLGHRTIAALLNSSPLASRLPPSSSRGPSPHEGSDYHRNSSSSRGSSDGSRRTTTASQPQSPLTSLSEGRRSESRSSSRASLASAKGPPPREPLPALPANSAGQRSSYQGTIGSSGSSGARRSSASLHPLAPSSPSPSGPLPGLPEGASRSRPPSWRRSTASAKSFSQPGSQASTLPSQNGLQSRSTAQVAGSEDGERPASESWTAGLDGDEDRELRDRASAGRLQNILDAAEARRRDIARRSLGSSIAQTAYGQDEAHDEDAVADAWASGTSLASERTAKPSSGQRQDDSAQEDSLIKIDSKRDSTNSRIVSIYENAPYRGFDGAASTRQVPVWPKPSQSGDRSLLTYSIEEDDIDSDDTISAVDMGGDGPRRKMQKRRSKSISATSFDYDAQRASAPSFRKSKEARPKMPSIVKRSSAVPLTSSDTIEEQSNPFAYYAFSPDLPPFVPQGLRPLDLTGRGTWTSIAARAGALTLPNSAQLSRSSSFASTIQAPSRDAQSNHSSPVSMRQLAAETRLKKQQADDFRDQQAALLAGKTWRPFDIITHATEHGLNVSVPSTPSARFSSIRSPPVMPHSPGLSVSFPHGMPSPAITSSEGIAYHFDPYAHLARGPRSEAAVGLDDDSSASFVSKHRLVKQYREFSQQTSPPASPEPGQPSSLVEASVGTVGDVEEVSTRNGGVGADQKKGRRGAWALTTELYSSSSEDETYADARSPLRKRSQRPLNHRRRRTTSSSSIKGAAGKKDDADLSWPMPMRTPRLSSRRSNIFTTPVRKLTLASQRRGSDFSLATGEGDTASLTSVVQSSADPVSRELDEDDDDDGSDESDLDLRTPITELAARTGAFDATSQARGAKRKAATDEQLKVPDSHFADVRRPIAGSKRVSSHGSPMIGESSPSKLSPLRKAERGEASLLQCMAAMSVRPSLDATSPGQRVPSYLTASVRSVSPDLDESLVADVDSDDDNESLMLSEVEFPYPTNEPSPRSSKAAPHKSSSITVDDSFDTPRVRSVRVKSVASSLFGSVDSPARRLDLSSSRPSDDAIKPDLMALAQMESTSPLRQVNETISGPSQPRSSSDRYSAATEASYRSLETSPPSSAYDTRSDQERFSLTTNPSSTYTDEAKTPPLRSASLLNTAAVTDGEDRDYFPSVSVVDPHSTTTPKQSSAALVSPSSPATSLAERHSMEPLDRVLNARSPLSMLSESGHPSSPLPRSSSMGRRTSAGSRPPGKASMASPSAGRGLPGGGLRKSASFASAIPAVRSTSGSQVKTEVNGSRPSASHRISQLAAHGGTAAPSLMSTAPVTDMLPSKASPSSPLASSKSPKPISLKAPTKFTSSSVRAGLTRPVVPEVSRAGSNGSSSRLSSPVSPASSIVPLRPARSSPISPSTALVSRIPRGSGIAAGGTVLSGGGARM